MSEEYSIASLHVSRLFSNARLLVFVAALIVCYTFLLVCLVAIYMKRKMARLS